MRKYCSVPVTNSFDPKFCSNQACDTYFGNTTVILDCPGLFANELPVSKCIHNISSGITEWIPPIKNCYPIVMYGGIFEGSLLALRDFELSTRNQQQHLSRPLASFAVGMSILSMLLVLSVFLAICKNSLQQTETEQTRLRRIRNSRYFSRMQSVGVQAQAQTAQRQPAEGSQISHQNIGLNSRSQESETLLSADTIIASEINSVNAADEPSSTVTEINQSASEETMSAQTSQNHSRRPHFSGMPWLPSYNQAIKVGIYSIVGSINFPPIYGGSQDISAALRVPSREDSRRASTGNNELLSNDHLSQETVPLPLAPSQSVRGSSTLPIFSIRF